jgi:hypothetical protein
MNKSDLKKLIKPLVKECINEVLIEEGLLSNVVSEVARGLQGNVVTEQKTKQKEHIFNENLQIRQKTGETRQKLQQHRQELMDSIGNDAYNGVNLFEGTEPMTQYEASEPQAGNIDLGNSADSGVDISSLVGGASQIWQAMK